VDFLFLTIWTWFYRVTTSPCGFWSSA